MQVLLGNKSDIARLQRSASGAMGAPLSYGATAHFNVASLPGLGELGDTIAKTCLAHCEGDRDALETWFGVSVPHFNIIIAPLSSTLNGTGGAYHATCSTADLYCDAQLVPVLNAPRTCALAFAEMVEVYEATQAGGWDCGASNGEGLSRVLASERYPGVMDDYAVAPAWLDGYRPDYVNATAHTDRDPIATGCSVLFLNYLHYVLKYGWDRICQSPASTLTGTYRRLTGDPGDPYPKFRSLLDSMFPIGQLSKLTSDSPWKPARVLDV